MIMKAHFLRGSRRLLAPRSVILAFAICLASTQIVIAQAGRWFDSKTGERVASGPILANNSSPGSLDGILPNAGDPDRAYDPKTGRNFHFDKKTCVWKDSSTGETVASGPIIANNSFPGSLDGILPEPGNPNRAYDPKTKRNFFRKPCTPRVDKKIGLRALCGSKSTDVLVGYAYSHAAEAPVNGLHGLNASVYHNVTDNVAVGGEVSGAYGSDQVQVGTGDAGVKVTRYTYLFGPQFSTCPVDNVRVFAHTLFGGAHDSSRTTLGTASTDFSGNAFAMGFGGGVDVRLNRRLSFRAVQADYIPTRFGGSWQNNFRLSTGLVIRFGNK